MEGNEVLAMYQSFKEKKLIKVSDEIYFYRGAKIQKPTEKEQIEIIIRGLVERSEYFIDHLNEYLNTNFKDGDLDDDSVLKNLSKRLCLADLEFIVKDMRKCNVISEADTISAFTIYIDIYYTFYRSDKPFYNAETVEQAQKKIDNFFDDEDYGAIHTHDLKEDLAVVEQIQSIKELAEKTSRSRTVIYRLAQKLGRMPTVEEVLNRPNGRPRKNWN